MIDYIQNLCFPSLIYLILSLFGLINAHNNLFANIIHVIVIILITYLLDRVCKSYGQTTSWYVLLILYVLPILLAIIIAIFMVVVFKVNIFNSNAFNLDLSYAKSLSNSFSKSFSKSLKSTEIFTPSKISNKLTKIVSSKM
jgi:hypothetical protein